MMEMHNLTSCKFTISSLRVGSDRIRNIAFESVSHFCENFKWLNLVLSPIGELWVHISKKHWRNKLKITMLRSYCTELFNFHILIGPSIEFYVRTYIVISLDS